MTPDSLTTAYHEAGHAVMALALGRPVQKVSIEAKNMANAGRRLGACELKKGRSKAAKDALEDEVLILLAGMVAEALHTGQVCERGAASDLTNARRLLAGRAKGARQADRLERRMLQKTEHLLGNEGHASAIRLIAHKLVQETTISGRTVQHLFDQATR